jgi:hypothetical protein
LSSLTITDDICSGPKTFSFVFQYCSGACEHRFVHDQIPQAFSESCIKSEKLFLRHGGELTELDISRGSGVRARLGGTVGLFQPRVLDRFKNLTKLNMRGVENLSPRIVLELPNLSVLDLVDCKIPVFQLPASVTDFTISTTGSGLVFAGGARNVRSLHVVRFNRPLENYLSRLPLLEHLSADDHELPTFRTMSLVHVPLLRSLDFGRAGPAVDDSTPGFHYARQLETLKLHGETGSTYLSGALLVLPQLAHLDLSCHINWTVQLPYFVAALARTPSLRSLSLSLRFESHRAEAREAGLVVHRPMAWRQDLWGRLLLLAPLERLCCRNYRREQNNDNPAVFDTYLSCMSVAARDSQGRWCFVEAERREIENAQCAFFFDSSFSSTIASRSPSCVHALRSEYFCGGPDWMNHEPNMKIPDLSLEPSNEY